jgi:hypothetical protein
MGYSANLSTVRHVCRWPRPSERYASAFVEVTVQCSDSKIVKDNLSHAWNREDLVGRDGIVNALTDVVMALLKQDRRSVS